MVVVFLDWRVVLIENNSLPPLWAECLVNSEQVLLFVADVSYSRPIQVNKVSQQASHEL